MELDFKFHKLIIRKAMKTKFNSIYLPVLLFVVFFIFSLIEVWIVINLNIFKVHSSITKYLMNDISSFSVSSFYNICNNYSLPIIKIVLLTLIYYSNMFFKYGQVILGIWFCIGYYTYLDKAGYRAKTTYYRLCKLLKLVNEMQITNKKLTKFKINRMLILLNVVDTISPYKADFLTNPAYSWFSPVEILNKETVHILNGLYKFKKVLKYCLKNKVYLGDIELLLAKLKTYVYNTAVFELKSENNNLVFIFENNEAFAIIKDFADITIKLYELIPEKKDSEDHRKGYIIDLLNMYKPIIVIAIFAFIIVWVGFSFFNVTVKEAFIAWFTVVFGSLTVSVGITTVSLKRTSKSSELQR